MPSAGFLIYSGVMPLVKTFIGILCGFVLARKGLFPPAAARGASQITMNLSLPCLIFANIVPAFTPANVSAIGPLLLIAFIYEAIGFTFGLAIREFCYIPRNFWQGILVLCGMSNWGNLPNAIVMTVTQQPPFDPSTDPALGVSFVSIFIVAYHVTFWVFGAAHSLSWDYRPGVPQGAEAEVHVGWKEKPIGGWIARTFLGYVPTRREGWGRPDERADDEVVRESEAKGPAPGISPRDAEKALPGSAAADLQSTDPEKSALNAGATARPPSLPPAASLRATRRAPLLARVLKPLRAALTPVTLSLIVSLPIALVPALKALFVPTPGYTWRAPDARAPLAALLDTAAFLGAITVPLALVLLGAAFARLRIPRPFARLPLRAMLIAALGKTVVLPAIGIALVQAMTGRGLVPREAKAERFVMMLLGGTPAAVNQLIVASLYSPDGDVDTLSAFLLVQYVIMFFTSSALTALALLLL